MNIPAKPTYTSEDWQAIIEIGGYGDPDTPAEWQGAGLIRLHLGEWQRKKDRWKLAKVPRGHWAEKSSFIAKPPLPANMLNDWIAKTENNAMGVVPYFKGLAVIDIDAEPIDIYRDQWISEYGPPLAEINTPSGGLHLLYPIKGSESNEAALRDWPAGQVEINGEVIGEVPCASRFAAMWEPTKWLHAFRIRKQMLAAGDDDSGFFTKFLSSDSMDWCTHQPAPSGVEKHYEHRDTTDNTRALFNAFIAHYNMTPNPAETGGYQGECPVCPENGTGTRFKATIKGDSVVFYCFVCGCGSSDDKLAILDDVRRRGQFPEAEQAIESISGSTHDPAEAARQLAAALEMYDTLGEDQKTALSDSYWLSYNSEAIIRLAREASSVKVEPTGELDGSTIETIQRAIDLSHFPETQDAISLIASKTGNKDKPELPMMAEIRRLGSKVEIPDSIALHEVKMLINAGQAMGVAQGVLDDALHNYQDVWRKGRCVKMHNGDFPLAVQVVRWREFDNKDDAIREFEKKGGRAIPSDTHNKSSDGVMTAVRATGVKIIWSELDTALMIHHPDVTEWEANKKCDPPEFTPLLQLQKGIVRSIGWVKSGEVDLLDANGKPVKVKNEDGQMVKQKKEVFSIWQFMDSEMPGKAFAMKLLAQVGSEIPRVDYTTEMTRNLMVKRDAMSEEGRAECVELAQDWLNRIPYIRPVNAAACPDLIKLASMIPYVVFANRRMQFMGDSVKPYSQRLVPVFGGIHRVGKTTLAKNLFPSGGVFEGRISKDFAFSNDENNMKRRVNGKLLVVNDELQGLNTTKPDVAKSFVTWSDGEYHQKFKNYDMMVRSDVLVATTNKSNEIPADSALQDRFVFFHLEAVEGYSDKERHDGIISWMEAHHERLMIGGIILAEQGVDLNPSKEVDDQRALAAIALDQSNNGYMGAVVEVVQNGLCSVDSPTHGPIVSLCLVCLHAGLLRYQREITGDVVMPDGSRVPGMVKHRRGETISPNDGDADFEWSEDVQMAFKVRSNERNETGAITQVKEAINILHGTPNGLLRLSEPRSVESWKGKRGKYYGFAVKDGRLAEKWGGSTDGVPF